MRILVLNNRIYRAFPELDPYTDDRCRKFIRAAQHGWIRRLIHIGLIVFVAVGVLVGGIYLGRLAVDAWFGGVGTLRAATVELGIFFLPVILAPIAGFLTRDFLLRRRVRWVLRTRGTCPLCRYSLIGLPVGPSNTVLCPECAHPTEVDPSLGELVLDEAGLTRFKPSSAALTRPPRIFTPSRVRFLKKAAIVTAWALGIGIPALWGGYELWLHRQAAAARAQKPGSEAIMALIESVQPPGTEGGANAWEILQDAEGVQGAADLADEQANPVTESGIYSYADFMAIYRPSPPNPDLTSAEQYRLSEAKARRLLDAYRSAGLYEVLDRMAAAPRAVYPALVTPGEPVFEARDSTTSAARGLARMNAARMALAQQSGDLAEFASALESTLALARILDYQPNVIGGLVGVAIEALAYDRLHDLLQMHPAPEWLDAADAAIARQSARPPGSYQWEGDRLSGLDAIAWVFSDAANVRWGLLPTSVTDRIYMEAGAWVGTYARNRDVLDEYMTESAELAPVARWQRPAGADTAGQDLAAPLAAHFAFSRDSVLRSLDQRALMREGYRLAAALERFRAATGDYPASLDALVPSFMPSIPNDPWTGKPWGYRLRAADARAADPRGFILYSCGEDGQDNGGARHNQVNHNALHPTRGQGLDFIINDWQPPQE